MDSCVPQDPQSSHHPVEKNRDKEEEEELEICLVKSEQSGGKGLADSTTIHTESSEVSSTHPKHGVSQ